MLAIIDFTYIFKVNIFKHMKFKNVLCIIILKIKQIIR